MKGRVRAAGGAAAIACALLLFSACNPQPAEPKPRLTLFVGVDASGSFYNSGEYDDSLSFLAHYIYGHMNGLGGLETPRELFVASIGGSSPDEPKSFHPYQDFSGKDVDRIEQDLRDWFPAGDRLTDFNTFFKQVARIVKERNLVLAPISIVLVTDGVPDIAGGSGRAAKAASYNDIDLSPLEYLARNVTLRVAYVSPKVGENWRQLVHRERLRLWTVDADVMKGWNEQIVPAASLPAQNKLWNWILDNVDYRVRSIKS